MDEVLFLMMRMWYNSIVDVHNGTPPEGAIFALKGNYSHYLTEIRNAPNADAQSVFRLTFIEVLYNAWNWEITDAVLCNDHEVTTIWWRTEGEETTVWACIRPRWHAPQARPQQLPWWFLPIEFHS